MSISNANPSVATFTRYRYVATGGETSISGADANGNVMSYSPGRKQVYLNGTMLVRAQDYTATTGTSITGITALVANDVLEVLAFTSFAVAAGVAQDEAPSSPAEGQLWLDTNGTVPGVQLTRWSLEPAAGTTSLTGADNFSVTLAYTAGLETVYRNGVLLSRGNDYTATNGTSITLTDATLAGDIIEVFGPSSIGFADAIANSLVDAKGDLITASSNNVPARIAVGSNDQVLVADSNEPNGLAWKSYGAQFVAGKNKIINGDFGVWQRGTSFTNPTAGAYTADRFLINYAGTFTSTISRQAFTAGTAPTSGYESRYFLRINRTNSTAVAPTFYQRVEGVNTLAGQKTTFSFWAKADANRTISINIFQAFGSGGGSASVDTAVGSVSVTTSWQRFSVTTTVPSISGKTIGTGNDDWMTFYLNLPDSTTFTFDTWGWQIEAGSTATPFTTATGTIQGELAACQRYYQRFTASVPMVGFASSTTLAQFVMNYKVPMRNTSLSIGQNTMGVWDVTSFYSGGTWGIAASGSDSAGISFSRITYLHGSAVLTQFRPYVAANTDANSWLEVSAEL